MSLTCGPAMQCDGPEGSMQCDDSRLLQGLGECAQQGAANDDCTMIRTPLRKERGNEYDG